MNNIELLVGELYQLIENQFNKIESENDSIYKANIRVIGDKISHPIIANSQITRIENKFQLCMKTLLESRKLATKEVESFKENSLSINDDDATQKLFEVSKKLIISHFGNPVSRMVS